MEVLSIIGKVLTLIGSLGLFLFGMKLMSEALQKVAGNNMRKILASMTNNRIKGVFTGLLVTTTIQSSSATTVMVVSFVNAGLLSLIAAIGVIMGANIGTTVTAWIISILGFKVSLSFLSLPLIGISFPFFFSKNSRKKSWGEFLIGFAILFIGLQFLKESVPNINNSPDALSFLSSYTNLGYWSVLLFVLIGTILTLIIQSSSATMALTLVLTYNGLVPFELAAAMVLGENIGTTITANLAALVANVSAKRAAIAHFIFNTFGVIWILIIFYPFLRGINLIFQNKHGFSILDSHPSTAEFENIKAIYPIALSVFHTTFNIINTLLLIGFAPLIAKIAIFLIPSKDEEEEEFKLQHINIGLLSTSELSIYQAQQEISNFGSRISRMFQFVPGLLIEEKPKKINKLLKKIEKYEEITDNMEIEIANYLTKVAEGEMSYDSSKKLRAMLKIIDDMESIGDVIFQISKVVNNKNERGIVLNVKQNKSLNEIFELVKEAINEMNSNLKKNFNNVSIEAANNYEKSIDKKRNQLRKQHVEDLKEKKYKHKSGAFYSEIVALSERIGDYVINVSEAIKEYQDD